METYYLLLYVGIDYLVPIVDSTQGDMYRFSPDGDTPFWLYFREDCDTTQLLYGQDNYRAARMGKPGYWGDFWKRVEQHVEATVHGVAAPYEELLRISGMLDRLHEWYRAMAQRRTASVPTICIFDENIGHEARKRFLKLLGTSGFSVRSYSVSFNTLLATYCANTDRIADAESVYLAFVEASGEQVRISEMIDRNDEFVCCKQPCRFAFDGENPIKMALVKHIVDEDNREHGFFTAEQCEAEYRYQMQYVDRWLEQAKAIDRGSFLVSYHLSIDPEITYQRNVEKEFITRKQKEMARPITDAIEQYCPETGRSRIRQFTFTGELFASEELFALATKTLGGKARYIGRSHYPDILHLYLPRYGTLQEKAGDYDAIVEQLDRERNSATVWAENANGISDFLDRLVRQQGMLESEVRKFCDHTDLALSEVGRSLAGSRFEDAEQAIGPSLAEWSALKERIRREYVPLNDEHRQNAAVYEKLMDYPYSKNLIERINGSIEQIATTMEEANKAAAEIQARTNRIAELRKLYPQYESLSKEFDRAQTLQERRRILKQMRPLTEEPLPEDPENLATVKGSISASVETKRSLFGLKRSPSQVKIRIAIAAGEILPYDCVAVVSDGAITCIDRNKCCFDLPKGTSGIIERTLKLPVPQFPDARMLTILLFVDTETDRMADPGKVSFNKCFVRLKEK